MKRYIVALDEGTTSTRAILYDIASDKIVMQKSSPVAQIYPEPSFVEENANEIYAETLSSLVEILESAESIDEIAGIGVTNQRETVIAWDSETGKPLYNAIVWQCRRTAAFVEELGKTHGDIIRKKTGLLPDAYFSASKIKWLIDNVPAIERRLSEGKVYFGTVDSFLIYKLTDGKSFVTDVTNASRTMLLNLETLDYDDELLDLFGIPRSALPKIVACDETVGAFVYRGKEIPVCGVAGDQQAALVGQRCFNAGDVKATYGTGLFMLCNAGCSIAETNGGLLTTVGYKIGGKAVYAYEGSVFNAGSAIQFLRDNFGFISSSEESETLATSVEDNGGVYFVPAFTGMGAPYWNGNAKGGIFGLTRGVTKAHVTRAALEAMAYSTRDLIEVAENCGGLKIRMIRVDGGASANDFLARFIACVIGKDVARPDEKESTALGAAYLCGVGLGLFTIEDLSRKDKTETVFRPLGGDEYEKYYKEWKNNVKRCLL